MQYTVPTLSSMLKSVFPLKLFFKKKPIAISLVAGILVNAVGWIWMFLGVTKRSEQAVLHYTTLFQVDQLGSFPQLYLVPAIGLIILLLNFLLAWFLYNYDVFISELILFVGAWLQLGILAAVRILVFLNA